MVRVIALLVGFLALTSQAIAQEGGVIVYIGTQASPRSQGIYMTRMDPKTGALSKPELAVEAKNPNFVAFHPSYKFLYACAEITDAAGAKAGGVASFAIDPISGKLTPLNQQPSGGRGPCFVAVDKAGKNVLVANYGSGSVACLPIEADGKLKPPSSTIQHEGKGVDPKRQEGPHAHSINLDAANRFAFAADLGLDKVMIYKFDGENGTLTPNDPPFATVTPGGGPRHLAWHPSGKFAYVNDEMGDAVNAFAYDAAKGALMSMQVVSSIPKDYPGAADNTTAEVVVHPSGKFLYVSNRGHDSIANYTIGDDGKLTPRGFTLTQGQVPRNFAVAPGGEFLLAANQKTDSIVVFKIDQGNGDLTPTGAKIETPVPICIRFLPPTK
jgi:6-phosphogluconolactonase